MADLNVEGSVGVGLARELETAVIAVVTSSSKLDRLPTEYLVVDRAIGCTPLFVELVRGLGRWALV